MTFDDLRKLTQQRRRGPIKTGWGGKVLDAALDRILMVLERQESPLDDWWYCVENEYWIPKGIA